ncbi:MAG TPA: glycine betaine ABC transporter substrate-binding protein [Candidatus Cybelea sp.]|nr:glycine betaine ABC transporter substrate-binding protein [Candidatus Cybelea sp.]
MPRAWLLRATRLLVLCGAAVGGLAGCGASRSDAIVIGSKNFPEQALLGEILAQQIESRTHLRVIRHFYLAGSYICQQALLSGRIDAYVEYTGTALTAILHDAVGDDPADRRPAAVFGRVEREYKQRFGIDVLPSLGFSNAFAIVVRGEDARHLHLGTISDAARYTPGWRAGFGYEFMERPDGFPGLARVYGLRFAKPPEILDLGLLYRALLDRQVDVVAGNSTDGVLAARDLTMLEDDKHYFPPYEAVPVVRGGVFARHPDVHAAMVDLTGKISDADMRRMNYEIDANHRDISVVARTFLLAQKH